ncbi:hypothetical protein [Opitutus sp. GAS368]|uniref:hypothetical protein n=1 Tax=Opitutus sp. GAS368 TaxID=1882749 RepID=UPI0012FE6DDA|nr:hypothetical protein [Opitutus sp. GAS368]
MNMPAETAPFRHRTRWLAAGITALLLPKCLLCVAGYIALAGGFAAVVPELCGGSAAPSNGAAVATAALGLVAGALLLACAWRRATSTRTAEKTHSAERP